MLNCKQIADTISGFTGYDFRQHPRTRSLSARTFKAIYAAAARHFNYSYTEMAMGMNHNGHATYINAIKYYKEVQDESFMWPHGLIDNSVLLRDVIETEPVYTSANYDFSSFYNVKSLLDLRGVVGINTPAARLIQWAADKIATQDALIQSPKETCDE